MLFCFRNVNDTRNVDECVVRANVMFLSVFGYLADIYVEIVSEIFIVYSDHCLL